MATGRSATASAQRLLASAGRFLWQPTAQFRQTARWIIWLFPNLSFCPNVKRNGSTGFVFESEELFTRKNPRTPPNKIRKKSKDFFEDEKSVNIIWEWTTPRIQCLHPFSFIESSKKKFEKSEKIRKICKKIEKSEKIRKICKNSKNPKKSGKSEKIPKIRKNPENQKKIQEFFLRI